MLANQDLDGRVSWSDAVDNLLTRRSMEHAPPRSGQSLQAQLWADRHISDARNALEGRPPLYGATYPFQVDDRGVSQSTTQSDLYEFLLLASNLHLVEPPEQHKIETEFERLAVKVIERWLGGNFNVQHFGTGASQGDPYYLPANQRLQRLRDEVGGLVLPGAKENQRAGDYGLDVLALVGFSDPADGDLAVFVQATCEFDFLDGQKVNETSPERWRNILWMRHPNTNVLLVPFCYRGPGGDWADAIDITAILIDRPRIIKTLGIGHKLTDEAAKLVSDARLSREDAL